MAVVADKPGKSCITATQGHQLFDLALTVSTDGYATMSVRQLPCGDSTATPPELTRMVVNLETGKEADRKSGASLPKPGSLERSFLLSLPEEPKAAFEACEVAVTNLLGASSLEAMAMVPECPSDDTISGRSASSSRVNGDGGVLGNVTGGLKCGAKYAWSGIKCGAKYAWSATKFCGRWFGPAITAGTVVCAAPEITQKCMEADVKGLTGSAIQLGFECVTFGFISYDPKTGSPYLWNPPGESEGQCKIKIEKYANKCVSSSVDHDGCGDKCCTFDDGRLPHTQPETKECTGKPTEVEYEIGLCRPCEYRKPPPDADVEVNYSHLPSCAGDQHACPSSDATLGDPKWDKFVCCQKTQKCAPNTPKGSCESCPQGTSACGTKCCEQGKVCQYRELINATAMFGRCVDPAAGDL
jgi:hypothetical protein